MTESQTCRMHAMDIIRRLAPLEYGACLAREHEADEITKRGAGVELPVIERVGEGPLMVWLRAA